MQSNNSPPSSLPIAGTYREPCKPKPTPEVPLFIDIDHFAEAQKKEEERLAVNKRKLEEMVRDIHRRANAKLNAGKPPQVETKAEERQPVTYYSDALGCELTFPQTTVLSTYKHRNPAFRNSYYPRHPYCRFNEDKKEPPVKKFKFDPPTFKFGDDEKEEAKRDEEDTATANNKNKEEDENDYDDAYDIPSHIPGVKLNKREIEMLLESSKRWKEKFNQLDSKPSSVSSIIKKSTSNDLLSPSATPTLASSDESTSQD